jgi:hypothetical protein
VAAAERADFRVTATIRLLDAGRARGRFRLVFPGPAGWQVRELLRQAPADQRERFVRDQLAPFFPGAVLQGYRTPKQEETDAPLVIELDLLFPDHLQRVGGVPAAPTGILPARLGQLVRRPRRFWPFVNRRYQIQEMTVTIDPGEQWRIARHPPDEMIVHEFLHWTLRFHRAGEGLVVERRLHLQPGTVPARDYPRLISLFRKVDKAEERPILLAPRRP